MCSLPFLLNIYKITLEGGPKLGKQEKVKRHQGGVKRYRILAELMSKTTVLGDTCSLVVKTWSCGGGGDPKIPLEIDEGKSVLFS